MTSLAEIKAAAEEAAEWIKNFRDGQFHVHCHKCGTGEPYLPPEFFGLVKSQDELARQCLWLVECCEALGGALRFICTTNDSGPWIETYRTAGGGYEGLQAVAEAALARLEGS